MNMEQSFIGRGRDALEITVDKESFRENAIDIYQIDADLGPGAVVGAAKVAGEDVTVIANDAMEFNPRFNVVHSGVIGLEEAYKMALAVYYTIEADKDKPLEQKRPIILIVDTPGNAPGKVEEILGMNKATGAYQLALAESRKTGHPVIAVVIGRAISGGFLCHGLQADHILALSKEYGTMIHVMPLTSIARITNTDIERLEELSKTNAVFAAGVDFFYKLGGVEEVIYEAEKMNDIVKKHIDQVRRLKQEGQTDQLGPWGRGNLGAERGGRKTRQEIMEKMQEQYELVKGKYMGI